jgi:glycosyltransferase involved in cell wall biosynthesis
MRVLMIAFGHPDNVLSLYKNVKTKINIHLIFVVSGDRFKQGILNVDIRNLEYGLNGREESTKLLPQEIRDYLGDELEIRFIRSHDRKLLRDKYLRNFRAIRRAAKILADEKYDIIHFNGTSGFLLYMLFYFGKARKIWTLHDHKPHTGEEKRIVVLLQKLYSKFDINFIQHYQHLREQIIKDYKISADNVYQVYSGRFDVFNSFTPKPILNFEYTDYILYFGRISQYKGIDRLVKIFSEIKTRVGIKLVIAGSGKLWFNVDDNNGDVVIINRYIETPELVYLIQNCRFVVVPYTDATHSATIMTAYAFNKPVITSGIAGITEVVEQHKTGILVKPSDETEFRNALELLIKDDELLHQMNYDIEEYCNNSHISWEKVTGKLQTVYDTILSS